MPKLPFTKLFMLVMLFTSITKLPNIYAGTSSSRMARSTHAALSLESMLKENVNITSLETQIQINLQAQIPTVICCLHIAIEKNNYANLAWLLKNGGSMHINQPIELYTEGLLLFTPLHCARDPKIIALLLANGADTTKRIDCLEYCKICDTSKRTPLEELYFHKRTGWSPSTILMDPIEQVILDQCITVLEQAKMSPERMAWLCVIHQTGKILDSYKDLD